MSCFQVVQDKKIFAWKVSVVIAIVLRLTFVALLGGLCIAALNAEKATVGNCYIFFSEGTSVAASIDGPQFNADLAKVQAGSEDATVSGEFNQRSTSEKMRLVTMKDDQIMTSTGKCVKDDDEHYTKMISLASDRLFEKKSCACFQGVKTFGGTTCDCSSGNATDACKKMCLDECVSCSCPGACVGHDCEDVDEQGCTDHMVLRQHFEWASTACSAKCSGTVQSSDCLACRQVAYRFVDQCAFVNPEIGGNSGMCTGAVDFDLDAFADFQYTEKCSDPAGCLAWDDSVYTVSEEPMMPLAVWKLAALKLWDTHYPNVFGNPKLRVQQYKFEEALTGGSRRLSSNPNAGLNCKWVDGPWVPLTPSSWASGSREFQRHSAAHIEVVDSEELDQCQTEGRQIPGREKPEIVDWDLREMLLADACLYVVLLVMKLMIIRKKWRQMNKEQRKATAESEDAAGSSCCSTLSKCILRIEDCIERVQSPFLLLYMTFVPAWILGPLLQATTSENHIVAPAYDAHVFRESGWTILYITLSWLIAQTISICCDKYPIVSKFFNIVGMLPICWGGFYIVLLEFQKLAAKSFGFEFVLFFRHIFSINFGFGLAFCFDILQLVFSIIFTVDLWAEWWESRTKAGNGITGMLCSKLTSRSKKSATSAPKTPGEPAV